MLVELLVLLIVASLTFAVGLVVGGQLGKHSAEKAAEVFRAAEKWIAETPAAPSPKRKRAKTPAKTASKRKRPKKPAAKPNRAKYAR